MFSRAKFLCMLSFQLGEPVGHKAGLTNPAVRQSERAHDDGQKRNPESRQNLRERENQR